MWMLMERNQHKAGSKKQGDYGGCMLKSTVHDACSSWVPLDFKSDNSFNDVTRFIGKILYQRRFHNADFFTFFFRHGDTI